MKMMSKKKRLVQTLFASLMVFTVSALANSSRMDESHQVETRITDQAANTQKIVSKSSENSLKLQVEIDALKAELKNLEVYRSHLNKLVQSQQQELTSLQMQLLQIDDTRKSIVPLMYAMLDGLETVVETDKPIRYQKRIERIRSLKEMMSKADISDAEKYRRILEALQIEVDYGSKMGRYFASIEVDGRNIEAEVLYFAKAVLVARSIDQKRYWSWSVVTDEWQDVNQDVGENIDLAFKVANKQIAPTLLNLPVSLRHVSEPLK